MKRFFCLLLIFALLAPVAAHAEGLIFEDENARLRVEFPEGWMEAPSEFGFGNTYFSMNPIASVKFSQTEANSSRAFYDYITEETMPSLIQGQEPLDNYQLTAVAKVIDTADNLYAIGVSTYDAGYAQMLLLNFFFTMADRRLGKMALHGQKPDAVDQILEILETAVYSSMPEALADDLLAQFAQGMYASQNTPPGGETLATAPAVSSSGGVVIGPFTLELTAARFDDYVGDKTLALDFSLTNGSIESVYVIPLRFEALQGQEELLVFNLQTPGGGSFYPGDTGAFIAEFLLDDDAQDVTFRISLPDDAGAGFYEQTVSLDRLDEAALHFGDPSRTALPLPVIKAEQYVFGTDALGSIPTVVGARERTMKETGSGLGYEDQDYTYQSDTVRGDLIAYIDYLGEMGFTVVQGASLAEPGKGELSGPSKDAGYMLRVYLDWWVDGYHIKISKESAEQTTTNTTGYGDPAVLERGQALLDAGAYAAALALYDDAIAKDDSVAEYHAQRANALYMLDREAEALHAMDAAIGLMPEEDYYYYFRGVILKYLEQYYDAERAFAKAIALNANEARYFNRHGQALQGLEKYQEAYEAFDQAVTMNPADWEYVCDRGTALYALGRLDEALADFKRAIELSPPVDNPHYNAAYVYIEQGAYQEAITVSTDGVAMFPGSDDLWCLLGDAHRLAGNYREALAAYDTVIAHGVYTAEDIGEKYAETKRQTETAVSAKPGGLSGLFGGIPTPQPVPPSGASRLMNYEDWLRPHVQTMPMKNILEQFISSEAVTDTLVEDAIGYPRAWPTALMGGAIPEYTGVGWLYDLYVIHPNMSYAAKDIAFVSTTVYEYLESDITAYVDSLRSFGYSEVFSGAEVDKVVRAVEAEGMSARCFKNTGSFVTLTFGQDEGGFMRVGTSMDFDDLPFVEISVNFLGRGDYRPDTGATPSTRLMNYEQAGRPNSVPRDFGTTMDAVGKPYIDEYNRGYITILLPSRWPKDIFGELIPEYAAPGMLGVIHWTVPGDTQTADKTLIITLDILDYQPADVERYIEAAKAMGYQEMPPSEYGEAQTAAAAESDSYRNFTLPGMLLAVTETADQGVKVLSITMRCDGRYKNFFAAQGY